MSSAERKALSLIARIDGLPLDASYLALKEITEEARRLPYPQATDVLYHLAKWLIKGKR